jgi:hypothetical protein
MNAKISLQRLWLGVLVIASAAVLGHTLVAPVGTLALGAPFSESAAAEPNLVAAGEMPQALLRDVIRAATQQTGVAGSKMTVIRAEATTWPDSALGCPQPGLAYGDQPVAGYWIVVDAGGLLMDYRTDGLNEYRRCISK